MAETERAATPRRLARISAAQAIVTVFETAFFGALGVFFGFIGLLLAADLNAPGAIAFGDYLFSSTDKFAYLFASGIIYVTLLAATRTRLEAGLSESPAPSEEDARSRIEEAIERINTLVSIGSYTASVIVIGGILSYEVTLASPILGIAILLGYHYFEHHALVTALENADSEEDISSPITPAVLGAALIAMVMMLSASPILLVLKMIGLITSVQEYLPSYEHVTKNIRDIQEHSVFMWSRGKIS